MKKTVYIAPKTIVCLIEGQELLNAISSPSGTNVEGLGVSTENYDGETRTKSNDWDIW